MTSIWTCVCVCICVCVKVNLLRIKGSAQACAGWLHAGTFRGFRRKALPFHGPTSKCSIKKGLSLANVHTKGRNLH